jgi:putative heme degradation protein
MLLAVSQGPAGESAHQLQFFDAQGGVVHTVQLRANLATDDSVLLTLPDVLTSRLIITTSESTSWIAWKEIWFSAVNDPGGQLTLAPF